MLCCILIVVLAYSSVNHNWQVSFKNNFFFISFFLDVISEEFALFYDINTKCKIVIFPLSTSFRKVHKYSSNKSVRWKIKNRWKLQNEIFLPEWVLNHLRCKKHAIIALSVCMLV